MRLVDRFLALMAALAYSVRRSRLGFLQLTPVVVLLSLTLASYAGYQGWKVGYSPARVLLMTGCLAIIGCLFAAEIHGYMTFRPCATSLPQATSVLQPDQKLFLRGSGTFAVNNMERKLVEVPVVFWSTELGEHILAAKVRGFNILGVGVPSAERGWWYIFLEPKRVQEIVLGTLAFGLRTRPAVRVLWTSDKGPTELYLSCDAPQQLAILLNELRSKSEAARSGRE